MKSIWVIEQGSYSDYRVVGVFSSRENARKTLALLEHERDTPSIAEWPLDPMMDEVNSGLVPYTVNMDIDGNTKYSGKADSECMTHGLHATNAPLRSDDGVYGTVWATDEKHAIKIANEFRTGQLIAGNLKRASEKKGE
jgi:hypothetical protein